MQYAHIARTSEADAATVDEKYLALNHQLTAVSSPMAVSAAR
jgi:hypothetical protein